MTYAGADFGLVGASYQAPMVLQDAQDTINWYLERDPNERAKEPLAMLGCPGLNSLGLSLVAGPVRGMWVLPGGVTALVVVSNICYLITVSVPATQTSIPAFTAKQVGTLLTNAGPVCIRDNGVLFDGYGGYAVIVDGQYCYYYLLQGSPYAVTFTAATTSGSTLITLPGTLPPGLIVSSGGVLTDSAGAVGTNSIASVNTVGLTITMATPATGSFVSDTFTLTIQTFGQITDPGFLGSNRIAFIEGWLIFQQPGTRTFYTTGPVTYSMLFPGAFFALKDSSTDNLITIYENNRELWLIGERTSEVWYNAGGQNFAFSRIPGVGPQIGCSAVNSITRLGPVLIWLAQNEQGENLVVVTNQYSWERVSNHGFEHQISQYPVISDAIGYAYEEEGHLFYMLTFPTADVTWCYDASTEQWHKRLSWNQSQGQYHRHLSNCFMNLSDVRIVGDYQNGLLYQMSRSFYTDNGAILRALRRTPHLWQKANRQRIFFAQLQVEFTPGVGLTSGQGSNPQAMLRFSDDGGFTWSDEMWVTIGAIGETRNRAIWYLLGESRDRIWEVSVTDPVNRDVIGATCYMEAAA